MPAFNLRSFQQIIVDYINHVTANSPLTDINPGSVVLTMAEAQCLESANSYIQMLSIIRAFNIDNLTGEDLVNKGYEYGLEKEAEREASGFVTFGDTAFEKVSTNVYQGLPGPSAGSTTLYGTSDEDFPAGGGDIIIGRNTNNTEVVTYTSITDLTTHFRFNLDVGTPLTKDHGTDETIILSQGGNRNFSAGTVVSAPETDTVDRVDFILQADATILDGEVEVENCTVVALTAGTVGNVGTGRIAQFQSSPFATATVRNPEAFGNGRDDETDEEFRERIKNHIQSLSRGVRAAIEAKVQAVVSEEQNNRVASSKFREATTLNELNYLYIDDGTGLEPMLKSMDNSSVLSEAAGTETFLQLDLDATPLAKAVLVTQNEAPYNIPAGYTLVIAVNGIEETITFGGTTDFQDPTAATAQEVAVALNNRLTLIEARTIENRTKVIIQAMDRVNESISLISGTANSSLAFRSGVTIYTLKLYKNDQLLVKDGQIAYVDTQNTALFSIPNTSTLTVIVDGKSANVQTVTFTTQTTAEDIANTINAQLSGATATVIESGERVRITSNNTNISTSSIQITGGTANSTGSNPLNFPTAAVTGRLADYVLNRFNGQIELTAPLVAEDEITAGSLYTRAYLEAATEQPYVVTIGEEIVFQVDDIVDAAVTTQVSTTTFRASSLIPLYTVNNHFTTYYARFKDNTTTVALRGIRRQITTYTASTGEIIVSAVYPANPAVGDTFEIVQVVAIPSTQNLNAAAMAEFLNPLVRGASFYAREKGTGDVFLRFQTNSFSTSGKIRLHASTTATGLGLTASTTVTSQESNIGAVTTANEQDFTLGRGQSLIVVMDKDPLHKTVTVDMDVAGTVSTSNTNAIFNAIALANAYPDNDFFVGFILQFANNTTTVAIRNQRRTVTDYNATTGQFTVGSVYSGVPTVGDTFNLIPVTAKNVSDLFNINSFSTLAYLTDASEVNNGRSVQLASTLAGATGSVQVAGGTANNFEIPLTSDGTAGGQGTTTSIEGLSIGLPLVIDDDNSAAANITITNITGSGPYTVTVGVDAGGTDISAYTLLQNAVFRARNPLAFSTAPVEGVDAYKYFGGLIQQVQWTIDAKDDDYVNYPGVKAAGVQIDVEAPIITFVPVEVDVTTEGSMSVSALSNEVKAAISTYINSLKVGEDVIVARIIDVVMDVVGVRDVQVLQPASNLVIQDYEIARTNDTLLTVG